MSEKFIVDYIDYSYGKETTLTKEFPFESGADAEPIKDEVWKFKRANGYKITRFQRYFSKADESLDTQLGGEI